MEATRVLVAGLPRMATEIIVNLLAANDDIEVISVDGECALADRAEEVDADVVVVGLSQRVLPGECRTLLERRPRTRILGVVGEVGAGVEYELRLHEVSLGELSRDRLLRVIRATPAKRRTVNR